MLYGCALHVDVDNKSTFNAFNINTMAIEYNMHLPNF